MINTVNAPSGDAVSLVQKLLKRADLNGDGDVTRNEFNAMLNDAIAHGAGREDAGGDSAVRPLDASALTGHVTPLDFTRIERLPASTTDILTSILGSVKAHE